MYTGNIVRGMADSISESRLLDMARSVVPPLSKHLYKGQCGRIAIIGGCKEYVLKVLLRLYLVSCVIIHNHFFDVKKPF